MCNEVHIFNPNSSTLYFIPSFHFPNEHILITPNTKCTTIKRAIQQYCLPFCRVFYNAVINFMLTCSLLIRLSEISVYRKIDEITPAEEIELVRSAIFPFSKRVIWYKFNMCFCRTHTSIESEHKMTMRTVIAVCMDHNIFIKARSSSSKTLTVHV